jgi:hypothetical protein
VAGFHLYGSLIGAMAEPAPYSTWGDRLRDVSVDRAPDELHPDDGCEHSPKCLTCQLPRCRKVRVFKKDTGIDPLLTSYRAKIKSREFV